MSDRYNKPTPGTLFDTWGEALNQNFNDIGADIDEIEASKGEFDQITPTYQFPTDDSSSIPGETMHELYRAIYNRDDLPQVAGIELVNYNDTGGGWYASTDRYRTGLRFLVRDGDNGIVEALEVDNKGNLTVAGTIDSASGGGGGGSGTSDSTLIAAPGGLVDTLAYATDGDVIRLQAGAEYSPGQELEVPMGCTLDFNNAQLVLQSDHNGIFLNQSTKLIDADIDVSNIPFTSAGVILDTARAGSYHGTGTGVRIENLHVRGNTDNMSGDGLLVDIGPQSWLSTNLWLEVKAQGLGNGIHVDVDADGHAIANRFVAMLWDNDVAIRHSGGGAFESRIYGEMSATRSGQASTSMIVNENSVQRCHTYYGNMYDIFNCTGDIFVGNVKVQCHHRHIIEAVTRSPNAAGMLSHQDREEVVYADLGSQTTWQHRYQGGWYRVSYDTAGGRDWTTLWEMRTDTGQFRIFPDIVASTETLWINDIDFGGGAGIYTNANGEVVIENENGATLVV